jgi:hypothetical protein
MLHNKLKGRVKVNEEIYTTFTDSPKVRTIKAFEKASY